MYGPTLCGDGKWFNTPELYPHNNILTVDKKYFPYLWFTNFLSTASVIYYPNMFSLFCMCFYTLWSFG